ncbi:BatA domain-containing protein [Pirellulaceae bacterium SH467]
MSFLHVSLLAGALLAVVPIALHMLGRKQPKAMTFPAIRFVRQTAVAAQKGWSIKRWLLLSLRVLLLVLAALALSSPRVPSGDFANYLLLGMFALFALLATGVAATAVANRKSRGLRLGTALIAFLLWAFTGVWGVATGLGGAKQWMPVSTGPIATAIVLDTSPSMGYQYRNKTRMDEAKEMAGWLMDRLPVGSQIAIVNSDSTVRLLADRTSANRQLEKTIVEGRGASLSQRIANSIDALERSELERREIYVLSDMSTVAWRDAESSGIATRLGTPSGQTAADGSSVEAQRQEGKILVQLIDVSVREKEKKNWGLKKVSVDQQSTVPGASVSIDIEVEGRPGSGAEQMTVELVAEPVERNLVVRGEKVVQPDLIPIDRQLIDIPDGGAFSARLTWKDLSEGTNHAQIRLSRPDPLMSDNTAFLSVEAKPQGQSLVVAQDMRDAQLIALAIEPAEQMERSEGGRDDGVAKIQNGPKIDTYAKLGIAPLSDYSNIVLFDPSGMDADTCDKLQRWVEEGGGLMIVMGSAHATPEEWMDSPIRVLLPGVVKRITRRDSSDRGIVLSPSVLNHSMWSIFERPVEEIPWAAYPVYRHWDLEELRPDAFPLMRFTQSELPALVEEVRGQGRIVTWAVPYPEPFAHAPGTEWSELFRTTRAEWPGYALFVGAVRYLASWSDQQLNYYVDQAAVLNNNTSSMPLKYQLFDPTGEQSSVESSNETLVCNYTRFPGTYRLKGLRPQGSLIRGFSVNVKPEEVSLTRVKDEVLGTAIGVGNYRLARELSELESSIGEGRFGRELSPFVLAMLVMLFMAEQTMASRFYAASKAGGASLRGRFPNAKEAA